MDAIRNILLTPKNRKISVRNDQGLIVLSKLHLCLPYRNHLKHFLGKNDYISFKTFVKKLRKVHIRCTKKTNASMWSRCIHFFYVKLLIWIFVRNSWPTLIVPQKRENSESIVFFYGNTEIDMYPYRKYVEYSIATKGHWKGLKWNLNFLFFHTLQ